MALVSCRSGMGGYATKPDRIRLTGHQISANRVKGDKHKILAQLEAFLEALKMPEKES